MWQAIIVVTLKFENGFGNLEKNKHNSKQTHFLFILSLSLSCSLFQYLSGPCLPWIMFNLVKPFQFHINILTTSVDKMSTANKFSL